MSVSAKPCVVRATSVGIEKEDYIDNVPDSLLRAGIDDQNSMKGKFERVRILAEPKISCARASSSPCFLVSVFPRLRITACTSGVVSEAR